MSESVHALQDSDPDAYKKPNLATPSIFHERVYRAAIRLAKKAEPLEQWKGPRRGPEYMKIVRQVSELRGEFIRAVDEAISEGVSELTSKGEAA